MRSVLRGVFRFWVDGWLNLLKFFFALIVVVGNHFFSFHTSLQGAWVAQSVKCPTLDFGSCHDVTFLRFEPHVGFCADSIEPAWDSLSPSLPLSAHTPSSPLMITLPLFLSLSK